MSYTNPVKFTRTNQYGCGPKGEDDVYTVKEFIEKVKTSSFIDYDGYGYPVKDKLADTKIIVKPSRVDKIPKDATHIVWFNK